MLRASHALIIASLLTSNSVGSLLSQKRSLTDPQLGGSDLAIVQVANSLPASEAIALASQGSTVYSVGMEDSSHANRAVRAPASSPIAPFVGEFADNDDLQIFNDD
mmetsp:Transcript_15447/g.34033  ORF Transcript_15447/g.34033 Transcript_15447/m.34033 type:complete len:106 (+) Transcript_15447:91-408(+)